MNTHWKAFLTLCQKTKSVDELDTLLNFCLTIDEKENIRDRVLIAQTLLAGKETQRDISEKYHVSIAKITRGSNALKTINKKLKMFLESHLVG